MRFAHSAPNSAVIASLPHLPLSLDLPCPLTLDPIRLSVLAYTLQAREEVQKEKVAREALEEALCRAVGEIEAIKVVS